MDADTKKREAGCTCHQEEGDSECVIHDPPTCKRCGCEYTMEWPNTEPTKYCNACAHAVVDAAEARAEKAEGERDRLRDETHGNYSRYLRSLAELASSRAIIGQLNTDAAEAEAAMDGLRSELAEARRQLGEVARERDALLDMARDISVYAATSARHGSERSMRDVLTMTANRARSFLLPKSAHGAGEAK